MDPKRASAERRARSAQQIQAAWAHLGRARLTWTIGLWATLAAAVAAIVAVVATKQDATGSVIRAAVGLLPILACFTTLLANASVLRWRERIAALQRDRAHQTVSRPDTPRSRASGA